MSETKMSFGVKVYAYHVMGKKISYQMNKEKSYQIFLITKTVTHI